MPYTTGSGLRIHYEVVGEGAPLLVHPGFVMSIADWYGSGYVDGLKGQYTLVLLDPRGQGQSDKPHETAAYGIERRVADALAVLDAVGIDRAHFLGYSMGGRVGFDLGARAPERFVSLVIGGMHPFGSEPSRTEAELFGRGMEAFISEALERPRGPLPADLRARWLTSDAAALAAASLVERPNIESALATMNLPVLLYCGDQDPNYAAAKRAASLLPNANFVPLPGLNHRDGMLAGAAMLPHLTSFLQRVSSGARSPAASS